MDRYDLAGAGATVLLFVDAMMSWHVRRSRDRFWVGDRNAIDTLHTVLEVTCRVVAPLMPFTAETIWMGLTGGRSAHLADWPLVDSLPNDSALVSAMDRVSGLLGRPGPQDGDQAPRTSAVRQVAGGGGGCEPTRELRRHHPR